MDLGLALPHYDHSVPGERPLRWTTVVDWARAAERAGLGSIWVSDHLFLSLTHWGGPDEAVDALDCLSSVAALARATSRARLGTLVICPHLRPAGVLAKALATIDVLSGGRLTIGVGAGWFEPEYTAAGLPFPPARARMEQLAETIEVLRLSFSGEPFDYDGEHLHLEGMVCLPRPVQQPAPPVWVGGRGDRLLGVVARGADGWNAGRWWGTTEDYKERLAVLERACEAAGRDPATVDRSVNRLALVGEDEADLRRRWEQLRAIAPPGTLRAGTLDEYRHGRLVGTVEQVREQLGMWAELGVTTVIVSLGALPFTVTGVDDIEMVASASLAD
ncbi:MAG: TIGR03619 family F420-dependent LLM class oxidoreductase [Acidimicrobiales bacterium]